MLIGLIKQWQQNVTIIKYIIHNIRICFDRRDNACGSLFIIFICAAFMYRAARIYIFLHGRIVFYHFVALRARDKWPVGLSVSQICVKSAKWAAAARTPPDACVHKADETPSLYTARMVHQLARLFRFEIILLLAWQRNKNWHFAILKHFYYLFPKIRKIWFMRVWCMTPRILIILSDLSNVPKIENFSNSRFLVFTRRKEVNGFNHFNHFNSCWCPYYIELFRYIRSFLFLRCFLLLLFISSQGFQILFNF